MNQGGPSPTCMNCGAPDAGDLVTCRFCGQAVSAEAARSAVPCPQCRVLNRWGKQRCAQCQAWIVVSCVFCGALSPNHLSNCLQCNEAFAGAPQRKAQMAAQEQHNQQMQQVGVWGNVAASFLGAAAGAALTGSFDGDDYSPPSVDDYDVSDVDDGGDFSDGDE